MLIRESLSPIHWPSAPSALLSSNIQELETTPTNRRPVHIYLVSNTGQSILVSTLGTALHQQGMGVNPGQQFTSENLPRIGANRSTPTLGMGVNPGQQLQSENLPRIGARPTPRAQVTYLHVVVPVMAMTYTKCPEKNTLWQENSFLKSNFLWTLGIVFINVWIMYHGHQMSQSYVLNVYLSFLVLNIWEFCNWSGCLYMNEPWITINFKLF